VKLLNPKSLANTIDAVNDSLFFDCRILKSDSRQVAKWLASRHGLPKSYAGMFAPTTNDFENGIQLFTGERIATGAATGHILGEETCRTLRLLKTDVKKAQDALRSASRSMDKRLSHSETETGISGFF